MIQIVRQGRAWVVLRHGSLLHRGPGAAVYTTYDQALTAATYWASQFNEELVIPTPEPVRAAVAIPHPAMFRRRPQA